MVADLVRTPVFIEFLDGKPPRIFRNCTRIGLVTLFIQPLRLFGTVSTLTAIPFDFPADRGWATVDGNGNVLLAKSCFPEGVNLVSFFLGEVFVGHLCNLDLGRLKALML